MLVSLSEKKSALLQQLLLVKVKEARAVVAKAKRAAAPLPRRAKKRTPPLRAHPHLQRRSQMRIKLKSSPKKRLRLSSLLLLKKRLVLPEQGWS